MNVYIIRNKATSEETRDMLQTLNSYIKLAVDVKREVVAGGGVFHADCESALLEDGSRQEDIWGADWLSEPKEVRFESLINIRPRQNNRSMVIQDEALKKRIEGIVKARLG